MGSLPRDWIRSDDTEVQALVVGGGFAGLYTLYKLREEGFDAKLIEASDRLGGVWNHNRYPGARVDSEVPYYQYSIPKVFKSWAWRERFPGSEEILSYFDHVVDTLDLHEYMAFRQNVIDAHFDTSAKLWTVKTEAGKTIRCKFLIVAAGSLYKKYYPTFDGLDKFKGSLLHSAAFPRDGYDFRGKRVAVVGQGATGIQITQEASKIADRLTIFVRTPNTAIPMRQRNLTLEEQTQWKSIYEHLFHLSRNCRSGFPYYNDGKSTWDLTQEAREARWEELWARGGFNFNAGGFRDALIDQKANDLMYVFWRSKVRARITDPVKADIFAPLKPPHPIGAKRPSLEQDYYECVDRANVEVVDLNKVDIQAFDAEGIVTSDGTRRAFDVIVLATGYDSITGSYTAMGLRDIEGKDMKERWRDGVRTHLGMTVPGFPNMFMVYTPQAPTAFVNGTTIIEVQADWIASALVKMRHEGIDTLTARPEAAEKWAASIQEMNDKTLFPLANSWYMGANIPGKKREQLNYLGGLDRYEKECLECLEEWTGFELGTKGE